MYVTFSDLFQLISAFAASGMFLLALLTYLGKRK